MRHRQTETEDTGHVSILKRSRADFKAPGLIPSGIWELRCLGAKVASRQNEGFNNGDEFEEVMFIHEPFRPTDSVDPEEANAVDARTGRSPYDGKRIFTKIPLLSAADEVRVGNILKAHLGDAEEGVAFEDELNAMKGKVALGDVGRRSWMDKNSGEPRSDNEVKSWAAA